MEAQLQVNKPAELTPEEIAKRRLKFQQMRERILSKNKPVTMGYDEILVREHHIFMKTYGWIPLEEFGNLPIATKNNLMAEINRDWEEEQRELRKVNKGKRHG